MNQTQEGDVKSNTESVEPLPDLISIRHHLEPVL